MFLSILIIFFGTCGGLVHSQTLTANFNLHILHFNDFYARFEETSALGITCNENCIGGFSRLYTAVQQELKRRPDSIVLNAGDNFHGTLWYSVLMKLNDTQMFLNRIPTDAYALGDHDFDDQIKGVIPFIKAYKAPTVVVNIDDSNKSHFQNIFNKSIIIKRNGKKIGIIGVTLSTTNTLANADKVDESATVNKEAERLVAKEKVDTIIVLSHCGYEVDQDIAKLAAPKISIVVGSHSQTSGKNPPGAEQPAGLYPTVIKNPKGHYVLVVQTASFSKYLGNITLNFSADGNAISWSGAPIYLDKKIPQDEVINKEIAILIEKVDKFQNRIVGHSKILLDNSNCRTQECSLGNLIADSMVYAYENKTTDNNSWAYVSMAVTNPGGIKMSINKGNISYGDLVGVQPFEGTYDVGEIQGKHLVEALEYSSHRFNNNRIDVPSNFLQTSGVKVVYNITTPEGSKVESVQVLCRLCKKPKYETLVPENFYRVVVSSFVASDGDGLKAISNNLKNRTIGPRNIDMLESYISRISPLDDFLGDRIEIVT